MSADFQPVSLGPCTLRTENGRAGGAGDHDDPMGGFLKMGYVLIATHDCHSSNTNSLLGGDTMNTQFSVFIGGR
jgi:hypothetical protein